ncbi:hypothetical protein AZI86_10370 [Bdellovibrio bacteriovorus]|uniref:Cytochrome c domain-containing protein n=1 Tax=Bdellovibrio bacteriovorus TaxID=959 RepID=A0A150WSN0_BDEBC|nr:cytochrome c [Bdellovibrio bacteriovorus]KYG67388.1 hypothetical protein AZI86_10370 [Bdellovibrio bacteriovorus]
MQQKIYTSIIALILLIAVASSFGNSSSVIFASAESKNAELQPVYNEIRFFPGWDKDVWMMNQSHYGRFVESSKWDRLAIVVDKTVKPFTAKFYQLADGPLVWEEDLPLKKIEFSVSCMICHNNGPRALRALNADDKAPLNLQDKIRVAAWNLRIKTYGRIQYDPSHDVEDQKMKIPFRHKTPEAVQELKVATCLHCHNETGFFARGLLQRQQMATIESLVSRGEMPPLGFTLSDKEKQELQDFIRGF